MPGNRNTGPSTRGSAGKPEHRGPGRGSLTSNETLRSTEGATGAPSVLFTMPRYGRSHFSRTILRVCWNEGVEIWYKYTPLGRAEASMDTV